MYIEECLLALTCTVKHENGAPGAGSTYFYEFSGIDVVPFERRMMPEKTYRDGIKEKIYEYD